MLLFWGALGRGLGVNVSETIKLSESASATGLALPTLTASLSETIKLSAGPAVPARWLTRNVGGEAIFLTDGPASGRLDPLTAALTETVRISDPAASAAANDLTVALSEAVEVEDRDGLFVSGLPLHVTLGEALAIVETAETHREPLIAVVVSETFRLRDDGPFGWGGNAPAVVATARVDLALGGSYRQEVASDEPLLWWRMSETDAGGGAADAVRDASGFVRYGTVTGGPVTWVDDRATPESGGAYAFTTGLVTHTPGDVFEFTGAFSVEVWLKTAVVPPAPAILAQKRGDGSTDGNKGWLIYLDANSQVLFALRNAADGAEVFAFYNAVAVVDDAWHHLVCTWDGTAGANGAKIYTDGVLTAQATASSASVSVAPTVSLLVGAFTGAFANPYSGRLSDLAIYAGALSPARVTAHHAAAAWTDVSEDLVGATGIDLTFGISGHGPTDRIADVGVCTFGLWNDAANAGGLEGYYSPQHANVRAGFTYGVLARVVLTYLGVDYPRFLGKIVAIDPQPGRGKAHLVTVTVHDLMDDLVESDLRNVTAQIGQTEAALLLTVLEALPVGAQPLGRVFDDGLDTCPYAFDNLGAGMTAYDPMAKLLISSLGYGYIGPTGLMRYENRQYRQILSSSYTFDDDALSDIVVPSDLTGLYNHVRAVYHPKTIDAAATTVLWSQTGSAPAIAPGATEELWGTYFNPTQTNQRIGGTAQVAPVATTDYKADTQADGLGIDKTANITVTAEAFASTVKFTITNNDAAPVYRTSLRIRGKGIYDLSPQTVESASVQPYGDRAITIDMPYQAAYDTALALAEYIRAQYENQGNQLKSFAFLANLSAAALVEALTVQIGDRVTVSETVTGVNLADVFVNSIHLRITQNLLVECELGVSPTSFFADAWIMDDADRSLAGNTTIFGYA